MSEKLISISTLALALDLSVKESWIRSMIFKNKIPFIKIGRHIRFDPLVIKLWIRSNNLKSIQIKERKNEY